MFGINLLQKLLGYVQELIKKNERTTMAISNCLFSPASENPRGFSVWCVLAKLVLTHATTHSRDRCNTL